MGNKKTVDIFDILPDETFVKIDELGYEFLKDNGYDVDGATELEEKRKEIKKALKEKGEILRYFSAYDKESKAILVWFELHRGKAKIAVSKGIKFLPNQA